MTDEKGPAYNAGREFGEALGKLLVQGLEQLTERLRQKIKDKEAEQSEGAAVFGAANAKVVDFPRTSEWMAQDIDKILREEAECEKPIWARNDLTEIEVANMETEDFDRYNMRRAARQYPFGEEFAEWIDYCQKEGITEWR